MFLEAQQTSPSLAIFRQIKYTVAINLERLNQNHITQEPTPLLSNNYSSLIQVPKFKQVIIRFSKKLSFDPTELTIAQLFSIPIKVAQIVSSSNNGTLGSIKKPIVY